MLFGDAYSCITINHPRYENFDLCKSIHHGCPLAPSLFLLVAEGFGYLFFITISWGLVYGIALLDSTMQLVNGHFVEDYFLTILEDEGNISNKLQCLDTLCLAYGSFIQ